MADRDAIEKMAEIAKEKGGEVFVFFAWELFRLANVQTPEDDGSAWIEGATALILQRYSEQ